MITNSSTDDYQKTQFSTNQQLMLFTARSIQSDDSTPQLIHQSDVAQSSPLMLPSSSIISSDRNISSSMNLSSNLTVNSFNFRFFLFQLFSNQPLANFNSILLLFF